MSDPKTFGDLVGLEKLVDGLLKENVDFLHDFKDFTKEYAGIEREYAGKLEALSRGYIKRFMKKKDETGFGMGSSGVQSGGAVNNSNSPPGTLTSQKAWYSYLSYIERKSGSRLEFAAFLEKDAHDQIKTLHTRKEEGRKKMHQFSKDVKEYLSALEEEMEKSKRRYHESCSSADQAKIKHDAIEDIKARDKEKKKWNTEILSLHERKNNYVLSLQALNECSRWLHEEEDCVLMNQIQDSNDTLITSLQKIMVGCLVKESNFQTKEIESCGTSLKILKAVDTDSDNQQFVIANLRGVTVSAFKPVGYVGTELWEDKNELVNNTQATPYLRNRMSKTSAKLDIVMKEINIRLKSLDGLKTLYSSYLIDPTMGDPEDIKDNLIREARELTLLRLDRISGSQILSLIVQRLGGGDPDVKPHEFRATTFAIPATCGLCKVSIWGVGKGVACRECGFNSHLKCQAQVPLTCVSSKLPEQLKYLSTGMEDEVKIGKQAGGALGSGSLEKGGAEGIKSASKPIISAGTTGSLALSTMATHHASKIVEVGGSSSSYRHSNQTTAHAHPTATVLYDYVAQTVEELSVEKNNSVEVIDANDGTGWATIFDPRTQKRGIIPSSYILTTLSLSTPVSLPRIATRYTALYDHSPEDPSELALRKGMTVELIQKEEDGWILVSNGTKKGLVPSSYVTLTP